MATQEPGPQQHMEESLDVAMLNTTRVSYALCPSTSAAFSVCVLAWVWLAAGLMEALVANLMLHFEEQFMLNHTILTWLFLLWHHRMLP